MTLNNNWPIYFFSSWLILTLTLKGWSKQGFQLYQGRDSLTVFANYDYLYILFSFLCVISLLIWTMSWSSYCIVGMIVEMQATVTKRRRGATALVTWSTCRKNITMSHWLEHRNILGWCILYYIFPYTQ